MNKGILLAQGRTAEIFEWGDSRVLKLFRTWCPAQWIEYEARAAHLASKAGIPVPVVDDIVIMDNRHGIIMERIIGPTMMDAIFKKIWKLDYYAGMLADLQGQVNSCHAPELMPQLARLADRIQNASQLAATEKEASLKILAKLPDDDFLCHNDLHPMNIILSSRGPVIIDWTGAVKGDPLSDVARTWMLILHSARALPFPVRFIENMIRSTLHNNYWRQYSKHSTPAGRTLTRWKTVIVAARFAENIPGESPYLSSALHSLIRESFSD